MTEITHHDLADEGFHEIQLSGKQLVFLFMATTIVAVVIFLCGVQVGRGVRTDRVADTSDASAAMTQSPVTAPPPSTAAGAVASPPSEAPPAPSETDDDLSYPKRLESDTAQKEQVKPRNAPAPAPTPAASAPAKTTPVKATPPPAASEPPSTARAASPPAAASEGVPTASRPGVWVIQVHALKDRTAAGAIARRLLGKGYPAFVLDPSRGAPPIYRVQVGRYNDRHEADQVARRLEKEEQFKPWVQH
jgi:cell division septation protein DedD